jgi:hypothetical protein
MTYQRVAHGDRANDGSATDAVAIVNAHSDGLEALEAASNPLSYIYPESYGAVLDGRHIIVTTTGGNTTITATGSGHAEGSAIFAPTDVGKAIHLDKVGAAGGYHKTTVAAYVSATQVTLTVAPVSSGTSIHGVVGTDSTTAIHNASQAAALGGVVYFKPADRFYFVPTAGVILLPRGCRWQGAGSSSSKIISTATTGRLVTWTGMQTSFDNLTITHLYSDSGVNSGDAVSVAPTSGCAIYVDSQIWGANSIRNCAISGFYDNIVVNQGEVFNITENYIGGARRYNLSLASATHMDAGQVNVWNNTLNGWAAGEIARTQCDIFWVSGGGLNIQNNTFGQSQANIQMDMTLNGTEPYVSNIIISGNTIEDFLTSRGAIWIHAPGNGDFSYVSITNNVIATVYSGGAVNPPIQILADSGAHPRYGAYGFYLVSIVGNVARVGSQKIALLDRVTDYTVVGNLSSNQGNTFTVTNSTGGV